MRLRSDISKCLYMYKRYIGLSYSIHLSRHKESDIAMNDWQAAANMLEQCNKQMNSLAFNDKLCYYSLDYQVISRVMV